MVPQNNAVNVSTSTILITFSERVDEASFAQALQITPEPEERPEIDWKKRTAQVKFRQPLDTNTTYILTLDSRLRDLRGVTLTAPITRAFATGPQINRGVIAGKVVEPIRGRGQAGFAVFAYGLPDTSDLPVLPERPSYRTETDAQGVFMFEYLSTRPYFILAVRDRNGNRRPDNLEQIALPPLTGIVADTVRRPQMRPWLVTLLDTIPPEIRRLESTSTTMLSVRYSESVELITADSTDWLVTDSASGRSFAPASVLVDFEDSRQVKIKSDPLPASAYLLHTGMVADSTGNRARRELRRFRSSTVVDTSTSRFVGFHPPKRRQDVTLLPSERPTIRFDSPVTTDEIRARVSVTDSSGTGLEFTSTTSNGVAHVLTVPAASNGIPFSVNVATGIADSTDTANFVYLTSRQLGGIAGSIVGQQRPIRVEAFRGADRTATVSSAVEPDGRFGIQMLPEGSYRLRIFADDNRNNIWDGGNLIPFVPAEPITWPSDSLRVRARWDTDVDTLRVSWDQN